MVKSGDTMLAGCSGQICADAEEAVGIITTCEYRPEYVCYKSATCERQADGRCGWTQTPELKACLANPPVIR
jgi:eight-cysteine-cluster-containing protein